MRNIDEHTITEAVLSRQTDARDARVAAVMTSLVKHLHNFAREVELTEAEWMTGIQFLTDAGHITNAKRQEFILLSDVLGLSMLVTALNHRKPAGCTEATVFGPFHVEGAPTFADGADIANGAPGEPCYVHGRITDPKGNTLPGAKVEVWQADANGFYDVQHKDLDEHRARGTFYSDAAGEFRFRSIVAEPYPIPTDGPVGRLLAALGRHPWRPAHLHFRITVEGYQTLVTHVFRDGGPYLDSDAVFGVRNSLIAQWQKHPAGATPDGRQSDVPYYTLDFAFVLAPAARN